MLDFHNHLIPGVDDGASALSEALSGIQRMRDQGVTHIITTPHFQASLLSDPAKFAAAITLIDEGWAKLDAETGKKGFGIIVRRGVELALDEPLERVEDPRLRLGGSQFILVEFPRFTIPPRSGPALKRLAASGVIPIVAHPERYRNLDSDLNVLGEWKRAGAFLQLNAGSLLGTYGNTVERWAWKCLEQGLADYLCSDYHSRGECFLEPAKAAFEKRGAKVQFNLLTHVNGDRLLKGIAPALVPRITERGSLMKGLRRALRRKS